MSRCSITTVGHWTAFAAAAAGLAVSTGLAASMESAGVSAAAVIYVDGNARQAPRDGSDWCHGYGTLSEALTAAGAGATIRIAGGVYVPDAAGVSDPREAAFTLGEGMVLEGGYAGCGAADPDARDPALYETVLSGDIGAVGVVGDNCYNVVVLPSAAVDTAVDGVTVTGGYAISPNGTNGGGGMLLQDNNATVRNCVLRQNTGEYGGGAFATGGRPVFVDTLFDHNTATASGGGLYMLYMYASTGGQRATVARCRFVGNSAYSNGGGCRMYGADVRFTECSFEDNLTRFGGGAVSCGETGESAYDRCRFVGNQVDTDFVAYNCFGGAVHNTDDTRSTFVSCAFVSNTCFSSLPGMGHGGAVANSDYAESTLVNCTIIDGFAVSGSAVWAEEQGVATLRNSILWNGGNEVATAGAAAVAMTYSTVTGGWPGTGNLAGNPLIADQRLQAGSPCIDTGDPADAWAGAADLDGHARVLCGGVDRGAYEFGIGDFDCDGAVSLADFAHWGACLTGPSGGPYGSGCESFDEEFDGDVDLWDFANLQRRL